MKKFMGILIAVLILVSCTLPCYAETITNPYFGISYTIASGWLDVSDETSIIYEYYTNPNEFVMIEAIEADWAYDMELADESALKSLCDELYSDYTLSQELSESNDGVYVTVTTNSVLTSYEYYNGIKYYRYEKAYTARAYGYYDTPFYETVFVTARNGAVYFISYQRDNSTNHFLDVYAMLNSLSYKEGEIKILINNERIYPDSAPMLIQDRTMVPIRAVAEKMGYNVGWDDETQIVTLTSADGATVLHFEIDSDIALKNFSQEITLDVPAVIIGDRTYLPLRAVAEAMDAQVNWNEADNAVEIYY